MLTGKKKKFAAFLKKGLTQKEAAIKAGYSKKTAKIKGSQLAKDKDVITYIQRTEKVTQTNLPDISANDYPDPLKIMAEIMIANKKLDQKLSLEAAAKLASFVCSKKGQNGKKQEKLEKAKNTNRFSPLPTPKLVVNNKK